MVKRISRVPRRRGSWTLTNQNIVLGIPASEQVPRPLTVDIQVIAGLMVRRIDGVGRMRGRGAWAHHASAVADVPSTREIFPVAVDIHAVWA